ncbi:ATP phosphoribosyltransferase regulatory subunit, partial [Cutibacterium acnes subsp. acnes]|nr:ATP phosphoribosyltransferase regulatory subunit [Cutibacterium acnes subsp. acnes]
DELNLSDDAAAKCVALASIQSVDDSFIAKVRELGVANDMLEEGLDSLNRVVAAVNKAVPGRMVANLKIARGLDYYTGTVYETELTGHESMGSVCSGGRYESLASDGKHVYPGVGISLGLTRLLAPILSRGELSSSRSVPSAVLVAVNTEEDRATSEVVASALRSRGIPCEVAPKADKFGKQIKHADRRGIPFVWFPGVKHADYRDADTVKDIRSGDQVEADAGAWNPPTEDLHPGVIGTW